MLEVWSGSQLWLCFNYKTQRVYDDYLCSKTVKKNQRGESAQTDQHKKIIIEEYLL